MIQNSSRPRPKFQRSGIAQLLENLEEQIKHAPQAEEMATTEVVDVIWPQLQRHLDAGVPVPVLAQMLIHSGLQCKVESLAIVIRARRQKSEERGASVPRITEKRAFTAPSTTLKGNDKKTKVKAGGTEAVGSCSNAATNGSQDTSPADVEREVAPDETQSFGFDVL